MKKNMNEETLETKEEPITQLNPEPKEDWKDKYLHTLAEMENMRKRMQKEKQEMTRFSLESSVAQFIPAMDNFENALRFAEGAAPEVKNWAIGFEMILSQFKEVLHNNGITAFHSEGNLFDPEQHEAVEIVETFDTPDGVIIQEFAKGYKSMNRTIRPARVKVAKRPDQASSSPMNPTE